MLQVPVQLQALLHDTLRAAVPAHVEVLECKGEIDLG
jgi:hypothetical protein